jgi:fatty acid desaturase
MKYSAPETFTIDPDDWPTLMSQVNADTQGGYAIFRRSLAPHFPTVWKDIALGYMALAAILGVTSLASGIFAGLAAAVVGAVFIGFTIAYLQLFIHEAAHWGLAKDRARSDKLANILIAWHVGTSIAAYRKVHFEHHRHLGRDGDEELSYRYPLSWKLLFEMVTGIHAVRILLMRSKAPKPASQASSKAPLLRGVAVHGALLLSLLALGAWPAALAWCGGMAIFFPVFATLRPLLEHRPAKSDSKILSNDRLSVTRVFDDGLFARIFGGAGFNRHLLHHWEPSISYTRLADLDHYLSATSIGSIVDERRTTYRQAFFNILASDRAN